MIGKTARVLKQNQVTVQGSVCLSCGPAPSQAPAAAAGNKASVPRQARIVESNTDYAVLEIICSCGDKSLIQCNYAEIKSQ